MTSSLDQLREAMQAGTVLLNTPRRDILPADLTTGLADVTATIWHAETSSWSQHFSEVLSEAEMAGILAVPAITDFAIVSKHPPSSLAYNKL